MPTADRIDSLNILLDPSGKDLLALRFGAVIENVMQTTISSALKNTNLSGEPDAGSYEVKRFANAVSAPYGTARAAGAGTAVKAKPIVVRINTDREIVEELEDKDTRLYGVTGLIERRTASHPLTMATELETAFFTEAVNAGTAYTPAATAQNEIIEELIQELESSKNEYVNGVNRNLMSLVMTPAEYGKLRNFIDVSANNANVNTAAEQIVTFHGVRIYSSVYLPSTAKVILMMNGAIAQPVHAVGYNAEKVPLSNAFAISLFYNYGTAAVAPDLIYYIEA